MSTNFGEKQFTKYFNDKLFINLKPKMHKLGIHGGREKRLSGKKFDIYFYKRPHFVIIESEIFGWHDHCNIEKLNEIGILKWDWRRKGERYKKQPSVVFFHIFSPIYSKGKPRLRGKEYCMKLGEKRARHNKNFSYFHLDIKFDFDRFNRMAKYFQVSRHQANQYYGKEIEKEVRRLSRIIMKDIKISIKS